MLAALALLPLLAASPEPPPPAAGWKKLAPGLELRMMDGGAACRKGPREIAVVRLDPRKWRIEPFSRRKGPEGRDDDIDGWQKRTGAPVIFNAGQYYPDRVPMGLFIKDGRNLGTRQLKAWKGVLVAEPARSGGRGLPLARILDLDHDAFDPATAPYRVALQSFMILDRRGKKRVRRSDWHANRTVVASDRRGRLLILHTEGAYTLWDLADWIARSELQAREAMSMDGGFEAQMCIRAGGTDYLSIGQYHVDDRGDHSVPGVHVSLPAVIALFPRR